ncbi:MAG: ribonuclease HII [Sandaracinaceae bacterium]
MTTLSELRRRYVTEGRVLPKELERALEGDARPGAQAILRSIKKRRQQNRAEGQRLRKMFRFERELYTSGSRAIAGVDEVGMSPLAGPLISAAVILPRDFRLVGVDDSKKLDAAQREALAAEIRAHAICFAIGSVSPEEIDRINIYHAGLLSMQRAIEGLSPAPDHILIDARRLERVPIPQTPIIKGDARSFTIAAASIVAKVHRDGLMADLDAEYPGYGFAKHKGYPVREHQDALMKLGVTPVHRRSFAPVQRAMGVLPEQLDMFGAEMPTA